MLHDLLKAYGEAYSAAINLRLPEQSQDRRFAADAPSTPPTAPSRNRNWRTLLSAFL
ncbi:MAG: hypothetical protein ACKVOI_15805 [Dongiaceae bacterium]